MSIDEGTTSWRDPEYLSTVAGVLAAGVLVFYSAVVDSAPSTETIGFVLLSVFVPMILTYEAARRWS